MFRPAMETSLGILSQLPHSFGTSKLAPAIDFTSIGTVILDETHFPKDRYVDVLGGSGSFATLGARLFKPFPKASSIGFTTRAAQDLPNAQKLILTSWQCTFDFKNEPDKCITRGELIYPSESGDHARSSRIPCLGITSGLISKVSSLISLRLQAKISPRRPVIVWEPRPSSCIPAELQKFLEAIKLVDIVLPNHHELACLTGDGKIDVTKDALEKNASKVIDHGVGPETRGAIVIRASHMGCLIVSRTLEATWLPAYYGPHSSLLSIRDDLRHNVTQIAGSKSRGIDEITERGVVDPIGAGNAFLGAFTVNWLEEGDLVAAACHGNIGASFALEQVGMPQLKTNAGKNETWNGVVVGERLNKYQDLLKRL